MVREYLCDELTPQEQLHWPMISLIMRSRANLCVVPMQDYLGLDNDCRMNQPSTVGKNWKWRVFEEQLSEKLKNKLRRMTIRYGRINWQWDDEIDGNENA